MLAFFRKYQKFLYILVTFVVVISFSFFGTYQATADNPYYAQVAFTTVNGTQVNRGELEQMAHFLATDTVDKRNLGHWGPNFLNDGVIRQDFLETGMAAELAAAYSIELKGELTLRSEREKHYVPYVHPQAPFLSAPAAWAYFAPGINTDLQTLRVTADPVSPDALKARVRLYIAQSQFSPQALKRVLRYQQQQYSWLKADPNLDQIDLSLFGYRTTDDWFGRKFSRLVAQFVINAAEIAEQKGYRVSREEALADLQRNSAKSFEESQRSGAAPIGTASDYFKEQLRRLKMDISQATSVWRQVLLFRRLFHDVGGSVFVDILPYQKLNGFASQAVTGALYELPRPFQMNHFEDLELFETYLNAISKRTKNSLEWPQTFLSAEEIGKKNPELVQKRYLLEVNALDKKQLQARVSLKETWNWEVEEKNWKKLLAKFPELGLQKGNTREEKLQTLDVLDPLTRSRVDAMARAAVVDMHPEWLDSAFAATKTMTVPVGISPKSGHPLFVGLESGESLIKLLDENSATLKNYSPDGMHLYRITVLDRDPQLHIVPFVEARKSLQSLFDQQLELAYVTLRNASPEKFQTTDKRWRPFADVKMQVAEEYFKPLVTAIEKETGRHSLSLDAAASLRLFAWAQEARNALEKDPAAPFVQATPPLVEGKLAPALPVENQWKFQVVDTTLSRRDPDADPAFFGLAPNAWSSVIAPATGNLAFFEMKKQGEVEQDAQLSLQVTKAQQLLSSEAQRVLLLSMLETLKAKQAIHLEQPEQGEVME